MRYLYQQLLAFWVVILVTLVTLGISFTQMTKQTIEENNYRQLFGYADAVVEEINDNLPTYSLESVTRDSLNRSESMLNQQNVHFTFITDDREVLYPASPEKPISFPFNDNYWENLRAGQQQQVTASTNIFGDEEDTSYAMIPFNLDNEFYGALIVTQSAQNVSDSVAEFTNNLLKGFLLSIIVALIISFLYAKVQVRRINRMKEATREIANGNFDNVLPSRHRDEFDELAEDFNKMTSSLRESQEEIDRQEERRRQFMADASHEMRTPLTTINGILEGLQYQAIPEDQKDNAIGLMKNETNRLIRLVNENLDYEKIRTNQISIVIKKFDGTQALQSILVQMEQKAEAANDQLVLETKESVPVFADYDRFVQIIVNIIQNSIQFTEKGEIRLKIEKGYLETIVTITDTGIGMTEDQVNNIFERYYKIDPSRKNKKFGESGLGLPIVQQLVHMHKGKIEVHSQPNEGTSFVITLPDTDPDQEVE
ncbi:two-component sensor histidine kinase [Tetragenococcus osmophilus]|uniref:histidine kinase n=1 Tax=Tetragenococcus osmophilus TaxID=526944 RepID=A0AA38CYV4_9ENTE|nr:HAMP domain-containing sensor histidine kinase [Tetragenococcus osmophilus]AYW48245.1 two-component sensor histidine kinase [Tetragenococcus osmophilus]GMA54033.1 two-component sensor histidine kinase [Alicyclobacillus contaminans]GMA72072.1 two-component sensor histidine kinase [Tetragenococcus osmophilus]